MKNATWEYVRLMSANLEKASAMQESELKDRLIKALTKEISETISKITGAA